MIHVRQGCFCTVIAMRCSRLSKPSCLCVHSVAVKSARYKNDDTASRLPSPLHHPSSSTGASVDDDMTTAQLKQAVIATMKRMDDVAVTTTGQCNH